MTCGPELPVRQPLAQEGAAGYVLGRQHTLHGHPLAALFALDRRHRVAFQGVSTVERYEHFIGVELVCPGCGLQTGEGLIKPVTNAA